MNSSRYVSIMLIFLWSSVSLSLASCEDVEPSDSLIEDVSSSSAQDSSSDAVQEPASPAVDGCGDGICQPSETKCTCPKDCGGCAGEASNVTEFRCVDGKCKIMTKAGICGNSICDAGEFDSCPGDCPKCEPDNNPCTNDAYDSNQKSCLHEPIIPCCGNGVCEPSSETDYCVIDCKPAGMTLKDYPKPFVVDKKVNSVIIVGSNSAGATVAAGIDIIRGWVYNSSSPGYNTQAKLDTEVDTINGKNAILLGNACENKFTDQLMKPKRDCHDGLDPGMGLIRLYQTGPSTYALVLAGYTGEETRKAAQIMWKYQQYGVSGYQIEVR